MADDIYDIYSDLPNFELDKECERLQHEVEDLKQKTDDFVNKIDDLTKEKDKLIKQKSILLKNISMLLKTARQEILRKDEIIAQLRNELELYKNGKPNVQWHDSMKKGTNSKVVDTSIVKNKFVSNQGGGTHCILNKSSQDRLGLENNTVKNNNESECLKSLVNPEKEQLGVVINDQHQFSNRNDSKSSKDIDKSDRERLGQEVDKLPKSINCHASRLARDKTDRHKSKAHNNAEENCQEVIDHDKSSNRYDSKSKSFRLSSSIPVNDYHKPKDRFDLKSLKNLDKTSHDDERDRFDSKLRKDANEGSRERYGFETANYRKQSDRYDIRNDSRSNMHAERRYYDNNRRGKRKYYEDDFYDKPYRSSRSPPHHSKSRSPNRKRRRSRSRGNSIGKKEACSISPFEKVPMDKIPQSTQPSKTDFNNFTDTKVKEQHLDKEKSQTTEMLSPVVNPIANTALSENHGKHNKSVVKEEGEMSDSDSYKDAEEEPHVGEWKSLRKKPEEAPKTIFTMRMEQKLKREDEERKRAIIHAAANEQNHVDTTLFDKPIKIKRNDNQFGLSSSSIPKKSLELQKTEDKLNSKLTLPDSSQARATIVIDEANCSENVETSKTDNESHSDTLDMQPVKNICETDKAKPTLNIPKQLGCTYNTNIPLNPIALVKQSVAETYSPFKENYKLIELSPCLPSKENAYSYHKNLEINRNEINQRPESESEKVFEAPDTFINNPNVKNPPKIDKEAEKESFVQMPESLTATFDIQKSLKPLLPSDIFGALPNSEASDLSSTKNLATPLEPNKSETNQDVLSNSCPPHTGVKTRSLSSYRIPKKSTNNKIHEKSKKEDNQCLDANPHDDKQKKDTKTDLSKSKRKLSSLQQDTKIIRLTAAESKNEKINTPPLRTKDELSSQPIKKTNDQQVGFTLEETKNKMAENNIRTGDKKRKTSSEVSKKIKPLVEAGDVEDNNKKPVNASKQTETKSASKILKVSENCKIPKSVSPNEVKTAEIIKTSKPISQRRGSRDKATNKNKEKSAKDKKSKSDNDEAEKCISNKAQRSLHEENINKLLSPPKNSIIPTEVPGTTSDKIFENVVITQPESSLCKEKPGGEESNKKKEELMSGLNLDATPLNLLDSTVCEDKINDSPCPITPDIPRELQKPVKPRNNCQNEFDYNKFSEKPLENKGSNDIANFEIFKSVNINNSSSSLENSRESKDSNRLQNDLCLSETDSDSHVDESASSCEESDSEASDIMEMFD